MVCCCALAGTKACRTCFNNPYAEDVTSIPTISNVSTFTIPVKTYPSEDIKTTEEFLKIISNLNQHIEDLRGEINELKGKVGE